MYQVYEDEVQPPRRAVAATFRLLHSTFLMKVSLSQDLPHLDNAGKRANSLTTGAAGC